MTTRILSNDEYKIIQALTDLVNQSQNEKMMGARDFAKDVSKFKLELILLLNAAIPGHYSANLQATLGALKIWVETPKKYAELATIEAENGVGKLDTKNGTVIQYKCNRFVGDVFVKSGVADGYGYYGVGSAYNYPTYGNPAKVIYPVGANLLASKKYIPNMEIVNSTINGKMGDIIAFPVPSENDTAHVGIYLGNNIYISARLNHNNTAYGNQVSDGVEITRVPWGRYTGELKPVFRRFNDRRKQPPVIAPAVTISSVDTSEITFSTSYTLSNRSEFQLQDVPDIFGNPSSATELVTGVFQLQEDIRLQYSNDSFIQALESSPSQYSFSSKETVSEILDAYEAYDYTAAERSQIATNLSYFKTGFASLVDEELNSLGFTTAKGEAEYLRSKFTAAGIPITDQTTIDLIITGLDPSRFTPAQKTAITTALSTTPAPTAQQQNDWDIVQSMLGEVAQYLKNVPGTQGIIQALETTGQGVNLLQGLTGVVQNNPQTADKLRLALEYFAQQPGTLGDIGKGASLATAVYTVAQTSYNRLATGQELDSAQIAQTIGRVQSIGALDPQTASLLLRINNAATGIAAISRDLSAGQDFKAYQDLKTVAGAIFQGDDLIKVNGYLATFEQTYRTIQNTYNGLNDSGDLLSAGLSLLTDSTLFSLKDSMPGVSAVSSTYQVINNTIAAFNGESGAAEKAIASALKDPAIKQLIGTEGVNLVTSSNAIYNTIRDFTNWTQGLTGAGNALLNDVNGLAALNVFDKSTMGAIATATYGYKAVQSLVNATTTSSSVVRSTELASISAAAKGLAALRLFDAGTTATINTISNSADAVRLGLDFAKLPTFAGGVSLATSLSALLGIQDPLVNFSLNLANIALAPTPVGVIVFLYNFITNIFNSGVRYQTTLLQSRIDADGNGIAIDSAAIVDRYWSDWIGGHGHDWSKITYDVTHPDARLLNNVRYSIAVTTHVEWYSANDESYPIDVPDPSSYQLKIDANYKPIDPDTAPATGQISVTISPADASKYIAALGGSSGTISGTNTTQLKSIQPHLDAMTVTFSQGENNAWYYTYADINGDGAPDLVAVNLTSSGLKLPGDGTVKITLLDFDRNPLDTVYGHNSNNSDANLVEATRIIATKTPSTKVLLTRLIITNYWASHPENWGTGNDPMSIYRYLSQTDKLDTIVRDVQLRLQLKDNGANITAIVAQIQQLEASLGIVFNADAYRAANPQFATFDDLRVAESYIATGNSEGRLLNLDGLKLARYSSSSIDFSTAYVGNILTLQTLKYIASNPQYIKDYGSSIAKDGLNASQPGRSEDLLLLSEWHLYRRADINSIRVTKAKSFRRIRNC
jgi:hypothetical protein